MSSASAHKASALDKISQELDESWQPPLAAKNVSLAVLLALTCGPFGLGYSTTTGMVVMLLVSIPLRLLLGNLSFLIILPVCAIWAWRASGESKSMTD